MLNRQYTNIQLTQKHYWENFKITDHKYQLWILKIIIFLENMRYLELLAPKTLKI